MRFSSITIAKGKSYEFEHLDRTQGTLHSIFDKNDNEYYPDSKTAIKIFKEDFKRKKAIWEEKNKRRIPKTTLKFLSAVVNLNEKHTLKDLKKVAKLIEKKFYAKIYMLAVHRDEGYIDENGRKHINYHGHILFSNLREDGRSIKRYIKKRDLIELQEAVANVLNMPRNGNPVKNRLDTNDYKKFAKKYSALTLKINEIQSRNAELEIINKVYKEESEKKEKENEKLKKEKKELEKQLKEKDEFIKKLYFQTEELANKLKKLYRKSEILIKKLFKKQNTEKILFIRQKN